MTDYKKWDNLTLDSDSDSDGDRPPPPPTAATAALSNTSIEQTFAKATAQFNPKNPTVALRTYLHFLAPLVPTRPPSTNSLPMLPTTTPVAHPSGHLGSPILLRLYLNIATCYTTASNFELAHHYTSAALIIASTTPFSAEPSPLAVLQRSKAFSLSAYVQHKLAEHVLNAATTPATTPAAIARARPYLLRSKGDYQEAMKLGKEAKDDKSVVRWSQSLLEVSELLGSVTDKTTKAHTSILDNDERLLVAMYNEAMTRYKQGQYPAALQCLTQAASKHTPTLNATVNTVMVNCYGVMAKLIADAATGKPAVVAAAGILKDIPTKCPGTKGASRFHRKAALLYMQVKELRLAADEFEKALKGDGVGVGVDAVKKLSQVAQVGKVGKVGEDVEEVYELDREGNMTALGAPESETEEASGRCMAVLSNLISLAGCYASMKAYEKGLLMATQALSLTDATVFEEAATDLSYDDTKLGRITLTLYEVQSDCLAGLKRYDDAFSIASEAADLANKLEEFRRGASMWVSIGHIQKIREEPEKSAVAFNEAGGMLVKCGAFKESGATHFKAATLLQTADVGHALIVASLGKAVEAYKEMKKGEDGRSKGIYEASRALGFAHQSYFDYATNDEVDVENALNAFKDARAVKYDAPAESRARVCMEIGNCGLRRRGEGREGSERNLGAFEEALELYLGLDGDVFKDEVGMAKQGIEQCRKVLRTNC